MIHGLIKILSWLLAGWIEKTMRNLRIFHVPVEIQSEHLLNTSPEHYRCTSLFSERERNKIYMLTLQHIQSDSKLLIDTETPTII
jgi:hypothetical protein